MSTIDGGQPLGLCGTGLINALAKCFSPDWWTEAVTFRCSGPPDRFRISREDDRPEFVLVALDAGTFRDIVINQADVENLIRTKAAIYAAAACLVHSVGLSFAEIDQHLYHGAFGNKLNLPNCVTTGLLPDVPLQRIRFIGNSSVAGAKMVMLSRKMRDEVRGIRDRITYEELMVILYMDVSSRPVSCRIPTLRSFLRWPNGCGRFAGRGRRPTHPAKRGPLRDTFDCCRGQGRNRKDALSPASRCDSLREQGVRPILAVNAGP